MPAPARQIPSYRIELPAFNGPLDLLLHLIEREELDITVISLSRVTEQYLAQIEHLKEEKIEDLIDFLVIGARLVLIKSRALLPQSPILAAEGEDEDPALALLRQLRQYKQFKNAAYWLQERQQAGLRTYLRVAPPPKFEGKPDLSGITLETLIQALLQLRDRTDTQQRSVDVIQPRHVTIEGQIDHLRTMMRRATAMTFHDVLSQKPDRVEIAVTLLAMLELIKRREVTAHQSHPFGPIELRANAVEEGAETPETELLQGGR